MIAIIDEKAIHHVIIGYPHIMCMYSLSLSLSVRSPLICGVIFTFVAVFYSIFFMIFGVDFPAYLSNHILFSREQMFVGFNECPSLMYWCTVIHQHRH